MPRRPNPIPTYRLHKPTGQAVVTLRDPGGRRRDVYLGLHGSPASKAEYERVLAEARTAGTARPADPPHPRAGLTVNEVALAFLRHAAEYYRRPDGTPTTEVKEYKSAVRILRGSHGFVPAFEFGPLALHAVCQAMIDLGWCRSRVNKQVGRIKRLFRWAAGRELVPAGVSNALDTVDGLRKGRSAAAERPPILPVPEDIVLRVLPHMTPTVRAMVELQLYSGMRPGEVRGLTAAEVDTGGEVWVYRPGSQRPGGHKMAHAGRDRTVFLGPRAREVLAPWLAGTTDPAAPVFSPRRSKEEWWAMLRAKRRSKVTPSQMCRRKALGELRKQWRVRWTDDGYAQAVRKACRRAGMPAFAPNQVRHLFATEVRARYGLEAAQVLLGHAKADITQVYAERDLSLAQRVAAEAG